MIKRSVTLVAVLALSVLVAQSSWAGNGILLVDDDCSVSGDYVDIRPIFEAALQDAGLVPVANATIRGEYEVYEVANIGDHGPDLSELSDFAAVIWFTGETCCTMPFTCLDSTDEVNLAAYLDGGGTLFLSAQDYMSNYPDGPVSPGDFPYDYLKVASCTTDVFTNPDSATGAYSALTEGLVFEVINPFTKGAGALAIDKIEPQDVKQNYALGEFKVYQLSTTPAFSAMSYKEGDFTGDYKIFFSTICLAALQDEPGTENTKSEVVRRIIEWFLGDYCDYGDAPDPTFPSKFETVYLGVPNAGGRHENYTGIFEWLGESIDLEFNSWQVDKDLYDDGISFNYPYTRNTGGSVDVTIQVFDRTDIRYHMPYGDDNLYLHGWFDWNADGDWEDIGENVFCSVSFNPWDDGWPTNIMTFPITFMVPDVELGDSIWTRFRLDYEDALNWFATEASYGEVEDYVITPEMVSVGLSTFYASAGDGQATLYWTTQSEVNNLGFYLLRSEDRVHYEQVNEDLVPGQGTSETRHEYSYTDQGLVNGMEYSYKLVDVDMEGNRTSHGPITVTPQASMQVPTEFALSQNYPNPFNAQTTITYAIPEDSDVSMKVFNVLGEEVRTLVDGHQKASAYQVTWDGKDADGRSVASGVYFCTLKAGEFNQTTKMVFLK